MEDARILTRGRTIASRERPHRMGAVRHRLRVAIKRCSRDVPTRPRFGVDCMRDGVLIVDVRRGDVIAPQTFDGREVRPGVVAPGASFAYEPQEQTPCTRARRSRS